MKFDFALPAGNSGDLAHFEEVNVGTVHTNRTGQLGSTVYSLGLTHIVSFLVSGHRPGKRQGPDCLNLGGDILSSTVIRPCAHNL